MFKVIVDRPRQGVGYYRTLPNEYRAAKRFKLETHSNPDLTGIEYDVIDEYCSTKLPMRNRNLGWDGKEQHDNLKPLRRFLDKQVGRLWNDVYSEISAKVNADSTVKQSHHCRCRVRDYVKSYVSIKNYYTDTGHWAVGKYGPTPISHYDLYVDENGILCDGRPTPKEPYKHCNQTYKERRAAAEWEWKRVINGVTYEKEDGLWFRIVRTERVYMRTYYQGGGIAPIKRLDTAVTFRKWTVNRNDLRDLKLN